MKYSFYAEISTLAKNISELLNESRHHSLSISVGQAGITFLLLLQSIRFKIFQHLCDVRRFTIVSAHNFKVQIDL